MVMIMIMMVVVLVMMMVVVILCSLFDGCFHRVSNHCEGLRYSAISALKVQIYCSDFIKVLNILLLGQNAVPLFL
jgi:hypothetical protein